MSHQRKDAQSLNISVLGAGLGGMSAAARLAKRGHKVQVFERSDRVGGKCQTRWIEGYGFDIGPSLLTLPAVYRDFFMKTGKPIDLSLDEVDPAFSYHFADSKSVLFPNLSRHKTLESIRSSFGDLASVQWQSLMERAEQMWQASRNDFVERALPKPLDLLRRKGFMKDLATIAPFATLQDFTRKRIENQNLRYIIDRYATYTGSDPREVPAVLLTIAFVEEAFGAWHIRGGIGRLAEMVYQRALDLGVEFHLNSEVSSVNVERDRVSGISLEDGTSITCDVVISNVDSYLLYNSLLTSPLVKRERSRVNRTTASLSGFSILLGLKPSAQRLFPHHHTVYFPADYEKEFDSIFKERKPVADPTFYICSPKDDSMLPHPDAESLFILINAPRHQAVDGFDWSDSDAVSRYGETMIDLLAMKMGEAGKTLRERIQVKEFRSPARIESEYASLGGSIYGPSSNGMRAAFRRAPNVSRLKGLYNVGGSAHPGGGLPLVGLSGEIVADAISHSANN